MKVGDKIWLFDTNRRVYNGNSSAPIYSEHFYQSIITAETSRSWIVGGMKFSKKETFGLYTDSQKEDKIWEHINRYRITEDIRNCSIEKLKQIDLMLKA